jgi:hypothetical protein
MKKFSAGGAQGRYERRMADIEKDFKKAMTRKTGKDAEVAEAKRQQRIADAKDDLAKRTGADRTATRAAEKLAESNLTKTRKYGAPKAVTTEASVSQPKITDSLATPKMDSSIGKPQSFGAAFKEARARLGAGKTFTFNGKKFTTNMAGEDRKPTSDRTGTGTGKGTPPVAGKGTPPVAGKGTPPVAGKGTPPVAGKGTPPVAAKPKESAASLTAKEAAERARMAKLKGNPGRLARLADITGFGKANALDQRAKVAAQQERIAQEQAGRAKQQAAKNQQRAASARKEEFINRKVEGETGLQRVARINRETAAMAKGGSIKKEKTMKYAKGGSTPPKPSAADRARSKKHLDELKKLKPSAAEGKVVGSANRSEGPGYKKGGSMASCGMKKGGKAKAKPFAATKFGAAMKKKSADTKGRAMMKFAKGGSIDGCAVKGKTKTSMVKMKNGGSC